MPWGQWQPLLNYPQQKCTLITSLHARPTGTTVFGVGAWEDLHPSFLQKALKEVMPSKDLYRPRKTSQEALWKLFPEVKLDSCISPFNMLLRTYYVSVIYCLGGEWIMTSLPSGATFQVWTRYVGTVGTAERVPAPVCTPWVPGAAKNPRLAPQRNWSNPEAVFLRCGLWDTCARISLLYLQPPSVCGGGTPVFLLHTPENYCSGCFKKPGGRHHLQCAGLRLQHLKTYPSDGRHHQMEG